MKYKIIIVFSLFIIIINALSTNISSYDDFEGNHNDIECHGIAKETIKNESIGIKLIIKNIFNIVIFSFSIILSLTYIYWIYLQRNKL